MVEEQGGEVNVMTASCCAECGKEEEEDDVVSLKTCKSCMVVKYCNAACQKSIKNMQGTNGTQSYEMRRCSKTRWPRKTVPFVSYRCH